MALLSRLRTELDTAEVAAARRRISAQWAAQARPEQLPPAGWKRNWYVRGGRDSGKTWTGSNNLAELIRHHPGQEWAVLGPTFGDARDVCMEGRKSGLLRALGLPRGYPGWNRSQGQLHLPDDTTVFADGADDGALRIQGKRLAGAWCDEIGLWKQWELAWDESLFYAVTESPGLIIATGTPKATMRARRLVKRLIEDPETPCSLLLTSDNRDHIDPAVFAELMSRANTRLGRQELFGDLLEDVEGALWTAQAIDEGRVTAEEIKRVGGEHYVAFWQRSVVALDPSDGTDEGDEQGLAVVRLGSNHELYVTGSEGLRVTPWDYLNHAVDVTVEHQAILVIEKNHGSEYLVGLLEQVLRKRGIRVPYKVVVANPGRGKMTRAEPVAGLYERGKVHHVGEFPELEAQMTSWTGKAGEKSPDRLDALVWALAEFTGYALTDANGADVGAVANYDGFDSLTSTSSGW